MNICCLNIGSGRWGSVQTHFIVKYIFQRKKKKNSKDNKLVFIDFAVLSMMTIRICIPENFYQLLKPYFSIK